MLTMWIFAETVDDVPYEVDIQLQRKTHLSEMHDDASFSKMV